MRNRLGMWLGVGIGAAAMYYLDPARGRYRRAHVGNQLVHAGMKSRRAAVVAGRDLVNRALGTAAALRPALTSTVDDSVVEARVRAYLGRVVSHPASIHVEARDGVVTLSGPVLEREVESLLDCVTRVHGVNEVRNALDVHVSPGNVPGLQGVGARRRDRERAPFMQAEWSPAERLVGAVGGAFALLCGLRQRGVGGSALGAAGAMLLGRAASNLELRRLLGVTPHTVHVQKSIRIHAPVERVFALWDDFESFPSFMSHVLRVRRLDGADGKPRWRWTVEGPARTHVVFEAVVTAREENELIAWRTEAGATVQHGGVARFIDNGDGTTTVDVKMVYTPIGGLVGHAAAWLLGADPKHRMDDDLLRMKTYLETGRLPRDAAAVRSGAVHARAEGDAGSSPGPAARDPAPISGRTAHNGSGDRRDGSTDLRQQTEDPSPPL